MKITTEKPGGGQLFTNTRPPPIRKGYLVTFHPGGDPARKTTVVCNETQWKNGSRIFLWDTGWEYNFRVVSAGPLTGTRLYEHLCSYPSPPPGMSKPGHYLGCKVYSREADLVGRATGAEYPCQLEGCRGTRVEVIWPDGKRTRPCGKGLNPYKDGLRII